MQLRRRIEQLEQRTAASQGLQVLLFYKRAGAEFPLENHRCVEILRECGFPLTGICCLDFLNVPGGLNAEEFEQYLREHAEEICGSGSRASG